MGLADMSWGNPKFNTLVRNGDPQRRLDIAIIGDGYTSRNQALFRDHAQRVIDEFNATEPFRSYSRHFNFHRINLISAESGTDDQYATPPVERRTALDTAFSPLSDVRLVGPDPWVMAVATMSGCPWDAIIVLINYNIFGGGVGATFPPVGYASVADRRRDGRSANFTRLVIHEASHAIAKLGDEYDDTLPDIDFAAGASLPNLLPWPNLDTNGQNPKWHRWLTPGVALPTSAGVSRDIVGAFEGGLGTHFGIYTPKQNCYMRLHGEPFCPICAEQWVKAIYEKSKISDSFSPSQNLPIPPLLINPDQTIRFRARVVHSTGILTTWSRKRFEDANWTRLQRTASYQDCVTRLPDTNILPLVGTYWQVKVDLEDRSTLMRTPSIKNLAKQTYTWHLISSS